MSRKRYYQIAAAIVAVALAAWAASRILERMVSPAPTQSVAPVQVPSTPAVPHIIATLYYAGADGQTLAGVKREVPLAEGVRAQGRQILQSQLEPAPAPYLSVIPQGTTLRGFYVTDRGDAFVDLSPEVSTAHPGGSTDELLTVRAIVNVVTENIATVQRVQILVGGKQVETLAGHVDLRRPFEREAAPAKTP